VRYMDKLNEVRKQLDTRWKQIDKFESSVKSYGDTKSQWRRKFATKEGELEALKVLFSFEFLFCLKSLIFSFV